MKDENKTRKQLISELVELRQRIAKMDKLENKRKKAEEALRESENRYKRLVEGSPDIVYIYSSKRGALYWSERVRTILGYAPTLLLEHPFIWHDSIHPDDLQAVDQAIAESGQRKAFDLEYRIKNSQGHWHWLHDRSISTRHFGDEILIEGLASDITERKEMEEDLRLQAEIMRNMAEGVILTRVSDGVIVYTNPKFEEIFGYGPGELIGKNISIVNAPTDKIPEDVAAEIQKCLRENNVWQGEVYNIKKDGTPFWCYANVSTFNHHYHGEVWVAVHTDITERKRAEEELQKSEALLIETQSITKVGGWELDVEKGQITWTDEVYRIYGVTQDYNPNDVEQDMQFYAPESIPILKEAFQRALEKGEPYDLELKFIRANGEHIWVRTIGKPVLKDGKVVLITGNFMDITERKKAEDRERLAHEVLDLLNRPESALYKIRDILLLVKKSMGFEAVGIRLQQGDDFPYYETRGFPEDFVHAERYLCAYDEAGKIVRDGKGNPVLECMCGNVLCGRTNATLPFFTKGGSFWTNSTTDLLASTTEEDRHARTRNRCNGEGYESVALIPLRSGGKIIGLLQLNDRRRNLFTPEIIRFCEGLGASIGIALSRKRMEEELKRHRDHLEKLVENRTHELLKSTEQLNQAKERLNNLSVHLRNLAAHLQSLREEERILISHEIHDELGHKLTGMKFDLMFLVNTISGSEEEKRLVSEKIHSMFNLIDSIIKWARDLMTSLRPSILDDMGIEAALEWLVKEFQSKWQIPCIFNSSIKNFCPGNALAIAIFRICQECLTNISRYAHATSVTINLQEIEGNIILEVIDNGTGVTADQIKNSQSFGLIGMRERAIMLGGEFNITGEEGKGTRVTVLLPAGS